MIAHDITGETFGHLTARERTAGKDDHAWWLCDCDCGGTKTMRATHLVEARKRNSTLSCGCRPRNGQPIKWACLFRGELRSTGELAALSGISESTLFRWFRDGSISEAKIIARMQRESRNRTARLLGLGSNQLHHRRKAWCDVPEVYTTPKGGRRVA